MLHEFRVTLKTLWRSKMFGAIAVIAFAFGIGSTATVFSIVDGTLLRPAAFPDSALMVEVQGAHKNESWDQVAPSVFDKVRARTDVLAETGAIRKSIFTVTRVAAPDQVFGFAVSGNFFKMLGAKPWLGRMLLPEDDRPGAPGAVLLSFKAWQQLWKADPAVIGKEAQIDGDLYTVVGVMPAAFVLPNPNSAGLIWTTLRLTAADLVSSNARGLQVFARVRTGLPRTFVQQQLDSISASYSEGLRLRARPLDYSVDATQRLTLWLAMGMVCGLLLIACANIASIVLARSIGRQREYAIRLATGASRGQLVGQALLELLVLAVTAFGLACVCTEALVGLIRDHLTSAGAGIPYFSHVELNIRSLLFSFGITLLCALLCGLFPALSTTQVDLASGLRETGTLMDGRRSGRRFLHFLLVVESAIALLLLLTSGLLARSLSRMLSDDHGLRSDRVLTMRLPTGAWQIGKKRTPEEEHVRIAKYMEMLREAQQTRGVEAGALASSLPLSHTTVSTAFQYRKERVLVITQAVTSDYFRVMGIPILEGHTFAPGGGASRKDLLVNQAFVRKYLNGENAIGKQVLSEDGKESSDIIGVVKDSPHLDLDAPVEPETYADFEQVNLTPFLTGLVVRTQGDPKYLSDVLRNKLSTSNRDQPIVQVKALQTLIDENVWQPRFSAWVSSAFAAVALCMCGIGTYGVVAYVTAARRRDFGIRMALGVERGRLLRFAAMQSLAPVLIGSCFGLLAFYWTSKWIAALLYKTSPLDPVNALICTGILLLISVAAVTPPALRAARVDPAITLRHE